MFARVATFEGGTAESIDAQLAVMNASLEGPPPEGLEATREVLWLVDRERGKWIGITIFDTEEDLRRGDQALNAMSPDGPSDAPRSSSTRSAGVSASSAGVAGVRRAPRGARTRR